MPRRGVARGALAALLACALLLARCGAAGTRGDSAASRGAARDPLSLRATPLHDGGDGAARAAAVQAAAWAAHGERNSGAADDGAARRLRAAADGDAPRVEKIGYIKTHKTGSTTLGATLFRFGARNHKRFYCQGGGGQGSFRDKPCRAAHILRPGKPLPPGQVFDLQLNHLSGNGLLHGTVGEVVAWYRLMLGTTLPPPGAAAGAPPEAWALVTPLRDPVAHYLSWYYYFGEPDSHYTVEQWLNTRMGANGLAAELGLLNEEDVRRFATSMAWGHGASKDAMGGALQLWLPVERFDEAMLLLRRTLRWTLLDITYTVMFDSHAAAAVRWDGKSLKPTPKVASLDPGLVARIRELNFLDGILYDAAVAAFDAAVAAARGAAGSAARARWDADAAEFAAMQAALKRTLAAAAVEGAPEACVAVRAWYTLSDLAYESEVRKDGFAPVPPAAAADAMMAAYARTNGETFC